MKIVTIIPFIESHLPEWIPESPCILAYDGIVSVALSDLVRRVMRSRGPMPTLPLWPLHVIPGYGPRTGFGETVDAAMWQAKRKDFDVALIWNSDAALHTAPEAFLPYFERDHRLGALAPAKTLNKSDEPADLEARVDPADIALWATLTDSGPYLVTGLSDEGLRSVEALSYCPLFAIRLDAYFGVGGYDPAFSPGFFEDADLWIRLRRLGWKTMVTTDILYRHGDDAGATKSFMKEHGGRKGCERLAARNLALLFSKLAITPPLPTPLVPYRSPPLEHPPHEGGSPAVGAGQDNGPLDAGLGPEAVKDPA